MSEIKVSAEVTVFEDCEMSSIEDRIISLAAKKLLEEVRESAKQTVICSVNDEIAAQVEVIIKEVIEAGFQKTNHYGEGTGEKKTVRSMISDHLEKKTSRYNEPARTVIEEMIETMVRVALREDFTVEISEAKDDLKSKLRNGIAQKLADSFNIK